MKKVSFACVCKNTPLPTQKEVVELGLLVYSVAMSGVWLRTYQGCVGEKDDGHLIIYDFELFDSPKKQRDVSEYQIHIYLENKTYS